MEKEFLEDRRRGLEEAFIAEHDAALRRRLREAVEAKAKKEALSAASAITDTALLERLVALGISSETLTALSLIPTVAVAWADGKVDELERRAVLSGAERLGVAKGEAGYELLEGWLGRRPPRELLPAWRDYIAALSATLNESAREALRAELLGRARAIAEASGGLLGVVGTISEAERAVLADLERAFSLR